MAKAKVRRKRHDVLVLYPRHRKPYRVHHVASLLLALAVVFVCVFELGVVLGQEGRSPAPAPAVSPKASASSPTVVRSGYGYSFTADSDTFTVSGTVLDANGETSTVTGDQLKAGLPLTSVTVKAKPGVVSGKLAATELSVQINPDAAAFTEAQNRPENSTFSPAKVAAEFFPVNSGSEVSVRTVSSTPGKLNGITVQKTVYEFTDKHGGGKSYAIQWSGVSKGRAFAVGLDGLVGSGAVPGEFAAVLDSLSMSADQAVLGASILAPQTAGADGKLDSKYLSDALSPAVVQIFHTVCGILTVDGRALGDSDCISFSGSGFLVTQSGYIATNGHVVLYTAKDALADLVTSNEQILQAYLQGMGLTAAQINATKADPAALAAIISKIYDLSDSRLHFSNEGEMTLAALGSNEPDVRRLVSITTSDQLAQFKRTTGSTIKPAKVLAYNYDPKDSLTAIADPKAGFSSSDVALLKIDTQNAPAIPIETGRVVQNEKIIIMGFPGNANNPLTDNQQTDVTVTDGVVSSIREAAGGKGKLYQSDAAASHGNSGGPAIDEDGKVIGLMTYRYADTEQGDAASSYIRDIADFTKLASDNGVKIDGTSTTQQDWESGLELYSKSHYSAALKDFAKVETAYPAQRLVASYISSSKDAIAAGKDVKDVPVDALIIILVLALAGAGTAGVVIIRHHGLHRVYQTSVPDAPNQRPVYLARPSGPAKDSHT